MFRSSVHVRVDVLAALDAVLAPNERLSSLVEALAVCEGHARAHDITGSPGIDCQVSGPLMPILVDPDSDSLQLLQATLRPQETLDGLVTALLIGEIRVRRTSLPAYVTGADEPVMTSDDLEHEDLIKRCNGKTPPKGPLMFTIPLTVRKDVLAAFDDSLADCEDRDEVIGLLIGTEAECRKEGYVACDGARDLSRFSLTTIDVQFDLDTHEEFINALRPDEDAGVLLTALMFDSLQRRRHGPTKADDLFAVA